MTATVVTGLRRETFSVQELQLSRVPNADAAPKMGGNQVQPCWTHNYDWRVVCGDLPAVWEGALSESSLSQFWVRDEPARPIDYLSLAAMCDLFYPRIYARRASRVPIGTVSLTIYFHTDSAQLASVGSQHIFAQAQGQQFRKGFFDQSGSLFAPTGDLLATTHQIVYYRQ